MKQKGPKDWKWFYTLLGVFIAGNLGAMAYVKFVVLPRDSAPLVPQSVPSVVSTPSVPQAAAVPTPSPQILHSSAGSEESNLTPLSGKSYGHLPYEEASLSELELVGSYGLSQKDERYEYLHKEASHAWLHMQFAAREQGVWLIIISGFRTKTHQIKVFRDQMKQKQTEEAAARYVAPPGFSEHHTGYTLDIGDGSASKLDLKTEFERTKAFRWLMKNAYKYGFELSFSRNLKATGVAYEPWHWRYVRTAHAQAIFAQARKQRQL